MVRKSAVCCGQKACGYSGRKSKIMYVGGLSVGLKEVLANHLTTQEGKAGLGSGCV